MAKSAIKDSIQQDQINFLKEGKKEDSSILRFALSFINKEEKDKYKHSDQANEMDYDGMGNYGRFPQKN